MRWLLNDYKKKALDAQRAGDEAGFTRYSRSYNRIQEELRSATKEQMKFGKRGKDKDKSIIEYNQFITLRNIPLRACDYVVNGKSAIEWIMERYCDKVDSKSGIRNDANQWGIEHGNPKYPLELLQSIITLSLRTLDIIDKLPKITFD